MNKQILFIFLFVASNNLSAQKINKIDSVINHYILISKITIGEEDIRKYPNLYEKKIIEGFKDPIYINKYEEESINFFEQLTAINTNKKHRGLYMVKELDKNIFNSWIEWIKIHKGELQWCESKKMIIVQKSN
ncbi:hypothetical protein F0358_16060 [Empedobacter brevis]|uniref:hypothetical protein n=1 Tax=Empedobacter brevis TaxID=247 RepID=UPI00123CD885|nr:hypothetical protein [Empedobacter brevis]QES94120.1 hypothetical protein F0358_16060 [Empedobacter brevis]